MIPSSMEKPSTNSDCAQDASVPPGLVHLSVALVFVWFVTSVYLDCEDLGSAKYDHVRLFGLQVYNDLYLDGEAGPGLVKVLKDAVVRVFWTLFVVCSFFCRCVWSMLRTSYLFISINISTCTRVIDSTVRPILPSLVTRARAFPTVKPAFCLVWAAHFFAWTYFSAYSGLRKQTILVYRFLRMALFISVAASLMAIICFTAVLECGIACARRTVRCTLSSALGIATTGFLSLRIDIDHRTLKSHMTTKILSMRNMIRTRFSHTARRGSFLFDATLRVVVGSVQGGASPIMSLFTGLTRTNIRSSDSFVGDYMRSTPRLFALGTIHLKVKSTLASFAGDDAPFVPTFVRDALSAMTQASLLPTPSPATMADVENIPLARNETLCDTQLDDTPPVENVGDVAPKGESMRSVAVIDTATIAEVEDDERVVNDTPCASEVDDAPLARNSLDDLALDLEPTVKLVEIIARLASELPVVYDHQVDEAPVLPVTSVSLGAEGLAYRRDFDDEHLEPTRSSMVPEDDDDEVRASLFMPVSLAIGALDQTGDDIDAEDIEPTAQFVERIVRMEFEDDDDEPAADLLVESEDDADADEASAPLATSISLGALDLIAQDDTVTQPHPFDLRTTVTFDTSPTAPPAVRHATFTTTLRDVLGGFEETPSWETPDRIPSLLLSVEGATSGRGSDGTVSSWPGVYGYPPAPVAPKASAPVVAETPPAAPQAVVSEPPVKKKSRSRRKRKNTTQAGPAAEEPRRVAATQPAPAPAAVQGRVGPDGLPVVRKTTRGPRTPTGERRRRQKAREAAERADAAFRLVAIKEFANNYWL